MSFIYALTITACVWMAWKRQPALLPGLGIAYIFALHLGFPWWGVMLFTWNIGFLIALVLELGCDALHTRVSE